MSAPVAGKNIALVGNAGYAGENCFYASDCGYKGTYSTAVSASQLKKREFLLNTLGWDETVWNIVDGQLPILKPTAKEQAEGDVGTIPNIDGGFDYGIH